MDNLKIKVMQLMFDRKSRVHFVKENHWISQEKDLEKLYQAYLLVIEDLSIYFESNSTLNKCWKCGWETMSDICISCERENGHNG